MEDLTFGERLQALGAYIWALLLDGSTWAGFALMVVAFFVTPEGLASLEGGLLTALSLLAIVFPGQRGLWQSIIDAIRNR